MLKIRKLEAPDRRIIFWIHIGSFAEYFKMLEKNL